MNKSHTAARTRKARTASEARRLVVANTRHSTSYVCALRLDRSRFGDLLGHAEFIHSL
jgi:hypothetical protein